MPFSIRYLQASLQCRGCDMAAKRLLEDAQTVSAEKSEGKRLRSLPSFTMVIREPNFCLALEPILRRVVREEMEHRLVHHACSLQRSSQMPLEEVRASSSLQLCFKKLPSLPIFTEKRIEDEEGCPLEILLVDTATGKKPRTQIPSSIKVELVVLDGDFPYENCNNWSSADFNRHIVKERRGRRPLLTGDIHITLKDGAASIDELKFTDNSSWIRSRHFRIGVRVLPESQEVNSKVQEAATNRFTVKDHRGESYKKHYPPALGDEVWRLDKISKDGVFHSRLSAENITTVQEFLKLSVIDSAQLRKILQMSDRNWETTINHARTCPLGEKLYMHQGPHYAIFLSPICEVIKIEYNGLSCTFQELNIPTKVNELALEAYKCWDSLEEISLPLQGEPMNQVLIDPSYQIESFVGLGLIQNDVIGLSSWSPAMQNNLL